MLLTQLLGFLQNTLVNSLLLAQAEEDGPRGYTIPIAIMLLSAVLGLYIALKPPKREDKVKVPKNLD